MRLANEITKQQADEHAAWLGWQGDYDGTDCPNCKRERVLQCTNGRCRCDKCNWDPDAGKYSAYDNR